MHAKQLNSLDSVPKQKPGSCWNLYLQLTKININLWLTLIFILAGNDGKSVNLTVQFSLMCKIWLTERNRA